MQIYGSKTKFDGEMLQISERIFGLQEKLRFGPWDNKELYKGTNVIDVIDEIKISSLRWTGHMQTMEVKVVPKNIVDFKTLGWEVNQGIDGRIQ